MHYGKVFPRQPMYYLNPPDIGDATGPTRKMVIRFSLTGNTGTVASLWNNKTVVSELGEKDADPLWFRYLFINPDDSMATVAIRVKWVDAVPQPSSGRYFWWAVEYFAYYDTDLLADTLTHDDDDELFASRTGRAPVGPTWIHRYDIPRWNQAFTSCGAANWADQPEFHPYRH